MPATSFSYLSLATPQRTRPKRITFPFREAGDYATQILEMDYVMFASNFVSKGIAALDSLSSLAPGMFFVEQSDSQAVEPGLVEFTRRYTKVPQSRLELESYVYTPDASDAFWMTFRVAIPGDLSMSQLILTTTQEAADEAALETMQGAVPPDCVIISVTTNYGVPLTATAGGSSGTTGAVSTVYYKRLFSIPLQAFLPTNQQGTVKSKPVASHLQYDYFQTSTLDSVPLFNTLDQFPYPPVVPPAVAPIIGFTPLTTGMVVEPSTLKRWKGNIWERVTRVIPNGTV